MDETVRFYRDVLGCDLVGTIGKYYGDRFMRHYFFSLGPGSTVAFFEWNDVTEEVDHGFLRSIYFDDPHGISLEISYWVVDITEHPVFGDERPVTAARETTPALAGS